MKIINESKNCILAEKATYANTFFKRLKGLLGRKSLEKNEALIISPANSIHTLFMCFPIDVLFVDKDKKVVKAISSILPFRISPIFIQSRFVVELPSGVIKSTATLAGDRLSIL